MSMSMDSNRLSWVSPDLNDLWGVQARGEMIYGMSNSLLEEQAANLLRSSEGETRESVKCRNVGKNTRKMNHPSDLVSNSTFRPSSWE